MGEKTYRKTTALLWNCSTLVCSWLSWLWPPTQRLDRLADWSTLFTCCSWPLSKDLASSTVRGSSRTLSSSSVDDKSRLAAVRQSAAKLSSLCRQTAIIVIGRITYASCPSFCPFVRMSVLYSLLRWEKAQRNQNLRERLQSKVTNLPIFRLKVKITGRLASGKMTLI